MVSLFGDVNSLNALFNIFIVKDPTKYNTSIAHNITTHYNESLPLTIIPIVYQRYIFFNVAFGIIDAFPQK